MKYLRIHAARLTALICLTLLGTGLGHATMVSVEGGYEDAAVVRGSNFDVRTFVNQRAGTVTLKVTDLNWTDLLQSMSVSVSLANGIQLALTGPGTLVFDIDADQYFTTSVYAMTKPSKRIGLYAMDYSFQPSVVTVPLPAGGWLLLGGLSALATRFRRRRMEVVAAV
jgi:hypothetical protein